MKANYNISKWFWIVTFGLYLIALLGLIPSLFDVNRDPAPVFVFAVFFGLLAQIVLGLAHVVIAIIVFVNYSKLQSTGKIMMNCYLALVILFFASWYIIAQEDQWSDFTFVASFIVLIPMLIGLYFVYALYKIYRANDAVVEIHSLE